MRQLKKTIVAGSMALLIAAASICVPHKSVLAARTITIDGDMVKDLSTDVVIVDGVTYVPSELVDLLK